MILRNLHRQRIKAEQIVRREMKLFMPKVEAVEKYKGNTFQIELSDGETYFFNIETVMNFHLAQGTEFSDGELQEIKTADETRRARERALYLLDYRDYSFVELYKKLEKNYSGEICMAVVNRLAECGLVDDVRYARRLAEKLVVSKGYGYYRAKQEMLMKGLDRELVEEILEEYNDDTLERLAELVERKYAHKITDRKSLEKVKNSLVRQGYSYSDVNCVLDAYETDDE